MATEKIQVSIPAELSEFAKALVAGGDFSTLDDVVAQALFRFRPIVETEYREEKSLRADIQEGLDAADRGDQVDGPAFMRDLIARARRPAGQKS